MSVTGLPHWRSVLAVVAHPDDESFGLGAVLSAFIDAGARVGVLCLTHGEASTLHGVEGDLTRVRAAELRAAADALGIAEVDLLDFPDGGLAGLSLEDLAVPAEEAAARRQAEGLVAFDASGVTGHPDHTAATAAAIAAGQRLGLPVLGWTIPFTVAQQLKEEFGRGLRRACRHRDRRRGERLAGAPAGCRGVPPEPGRAGQRALAPARAARRP